MLSLSEQLKLAVCRAAVVKQPQVILSEKVAYICHVSGAIQQVVSPVDRSNLIQHGGYHGSDEKRT